MQSHINSNFYCLGIRFPMVINWRFGFFLWQWRLRHCQLLLRSQRQCPQMGSHRVSSHILRRAANALCPVRAPSGQCPRRACQLSFLWKPEQLLCRRLGWHRRPRLRGWRWKWSHVNLCQPNACCQGLPIDPNLLQFCSWRALQICSLWWGHFLQMGRPWLCQQLISKRYYVPSSLLACLSWILWETYHTMELRFVI